MSALPHAADAALWNLRRGTPHPPPARLRLRAGSLAVDLVDGFVECVEPYGATLTSIYGAVRDRNWGTVPGVLSAVAHETGGDAFQVTFHCAHLQEGIHFEWDGRVVGRRDGSLDFEMSGVARTAFARSRIGLCVLLDAAVAEAGFAVTHTDGRRSSVAPFARVRPWQPARRIAALHLADPAGAYTLTFEGDVFEMEDERNWSDAGLKVYGTPLALPHPVTVQPGDVVRQSVRLTPRAKLARRRSARKPPASPRADGHVCRLGVRLRPGAEALPPERLDLLRLAGLDHLRVELDLADADWRAALQRAAASALALGCSLEAALHVPGRRPASLLHQAAETARDLGVPIARWLLHGKDARVTPAAIDRAAMAVLARPDGPPVGCGADSNFAELNRSRTRWQCGGLLYCAANPQGHLRSDEALLRNARGLAHVAAALRAGVPRGQAVISPLTLQPVLIAAAADRNAGPPPPDPRIASLIGACWLVASLQQCAGALNALTVLEADGPRGLVSDRGVRPLFHVLADASQMRGAAVRGRTGAAGRAATVEFAACGRRRLLVANLAPQPVAWLEPGLRGGVARVLDETTAEQAARDPAAWRAAAPCPVDREGITLLPYAVATVDCGEEV